jgi:hypothetical protein
MRRNQVDQDGARPSDRRGESDHRDDDPPILIVPAAVIGFLLLVTVALACAFYIAAQVVQTP